MQQYFLNHLEASLFQTRFSRVTRQTMTQGPLEGGMIESKSVSSPHELKWMLYLSVIRRTML